MPCKNINPSLIGKILSVLQAAGRTSRRALYLLEIIICNPFRCDSFYCKLPCKSALLPATAKIVELNPRWRWIDGVRLLLKDGCPAICATPHRNSPI